MAARLVVETEFHPGGARGGKPQKGPEKKRKKHKKARSPGKTKDRPPQAGQRWLPSGRNPEPHHGLFDETTPSRWRERSSGRMLSRAQASKHQMLRAEQKIIGFKRSPNSPVGFKRSPLPVSPKCPCRLHAEPMACFVKEKRREQEKERERGKEGTGGEDGPLHASSVCACSVHPDSDITGGRSHTTTRRQEKERQLASSGAQENL